MAGRRNNALTKMTAPSNPCRVRSPKFCVWAEIFTTTIDSGREAGLSDGLAGRARHPVRRFGPRPAGRTRSAAASDPRGPPGGRGGSLGQPRRSQPRLRRCGASAPRPASAPRRGGVVPQLTRAPSGAHRSSGAPPLLPPLSAETGEERGASPGPHTLGADGPSLAAPRELWGARRGSRVRRRAAHPCPFAPPQVSDGTPAHERQPTVAARRTGRSGRR